mmetsp:Transcript_5660/g.11751  ORF Transcript_5660/g.11751 Transcript_5660/m.11751 type:complete len:291 (-) Transcript_5660:1484-2356(-)
MVLDCFWNEVATSEMIVHVAQLAWQGATSGWKETAQPQASVIATRTTSQSRKTCLEAAAIPNALRGSQSHHLNLGQEDKQKLCHEWSICRVDQLNRLCLVIGPRFVFRRAKWRSVGPSVDCVFGYNNAVRGISQTKLHCGVTPIFLGVRGPLRWFILEIRKSVAVILWQAIAIGKMFAKHHGKTLVDLSQRRGKSRRSSRPGIGRLVSTKAAADAHLLGPNGIVSCLAIIRTCTTNFNQLTAHKAMELGEPIGILIDTQAKLGALCEMWDTAFIQGRQERTGHGGCIAVD